MSANANRSFSEAQNSLELKTFLDLGGDVDLWTRQLRLICQISALNKAYVDAFTSTLSSLQELIQKQLKLQEAGQRQSRMKRLMVGISRSREFRAWAEEFRPAVQTLRFISDTASATLATRHLSLPSLEPRERAFGYEALNQANFEIRLLEIEPASSDHTTKIECRLILTSLVRPPVYHALSYHWGDRDHAETIVLNGAEMPVTQNLERALRSLRARGIYRVWVDAVCINQEDLYEKAAQIQQMPQIYSRAKLVIAWLGEESEDSDVAMELSSASRGSGDRDLDTSVYAALRDLMERPYWTRKWIIQELAKASSVEILCGKASGSLNTVLRMAVEDHNLIGLSPNRNALLRSIQLFRDQEQRALRGNTRMCLWQALVAARNSSATHRVDNIYGILGMTSDGADVVPIANYMESIEEVFIGATRNMVHRQGQLTLMLLARRSSSDTLDLPSWVPDWSNLPNVIPPWIQKLLDDTKSIKLQESEPESPDTVLNSRVLTASGCVVDRVLTVAYATDTSKRLSSDEEMSQAITASEIASSLLVLESLWNALAACHESQKVTGTLGQHMLATPGRRRKTYALDTFWFAEKPSPLYSERFQNFCNQIADLQLAGYTIAQLVQKHHKFLTRMPHVGVVDLGGILADLDGSLGQMAMNCMSAVVTESGRFVLGYEGVRTSDVICQLDGCALPVILRPREDGRYEYVGEACGLGRHNPMLGVAFGAENRGFRIV